MKKITLVAPRDEAQVASERTEDAVSRENEERDLDVGRPLAQIMLYIALLPERYQPVMRLYDIEGCSYLEIARLLSRPLGTIKCQVSRGRKLLRRFLNDKDAPYAADRKGEDQRASRWSSPEMVARIEKLPGSYRVIMGLHYRDGYTIVAMARMLRKPVGTIKSQIHRGRLMLLGA